MARVTATLNFQFDGTLIDLDVNGPCGCWLPDWPAQQN